jgi:hypothetical protein
LARVKKKILGEEKTLGEEILRREQKKNTLGEEFFTESKPSGSRRRNSSPRVFLLLSAKKF